jgi:hypothetical protein
LKGELLVNTEIGVGEVVLLEGISAAIPLRFLQQNVQGI